MGFETGGKYAGPERRLERQSELLGIHARLREGDTVMSEFRESLRANTELTRLTAATVSRIDENTAGFIAFSNDLVSGTKFLCRCAKGVQWAGEMVRKNWFVLACFIALYAYLTNQTKLLEFIVSVSKP